ncbi:hypothetical protein HaLaN_13518 [Haematococcus lacustris]|uniref:Uncharacterized protein n=1 Tax=Haematococcus lacustris TaxID=44745 RepID=A0A699ZDD0_HAELA|nr:hypothetical protein HaLaN_13518 [Haematococcus lacustris]
MPAGRAGRLVGVTEAYIHVRLSPNTSFGSAHIKGSVTLRGAESKLGHGVELLSDAGGRSDDCMLRYGSNLNH